jgi:hypothetical protein
MIFVAKLLAKGHQNVVLVVGGILSVIYLSVAVQYSGGIYLSPLSYSFVYLPAVVTWYLMSEESNGRQIAQSIFYCTLCFVAYFYLLVKVESTTSTAVWLMANGAHHYDYKALKALVLLFELAATLVFAIISARSQSAATRAA